MRGIRLASGLSDPFPHKVLDQRLVLQKGKRLREIKSGI